MSFLDNLEDNLKALEGREEGGLDESRRRAAERERSLAVAPWAERLKTEPYARDLMQKATLAGRERRIKVNLAWIDTTLRLEARGQRLELRPTRDGVIAVFLREADETRREPVDLSGDPREIVEEWMILLDAEKKISDEMVSDESL